MLRDLGLGMTSIGGFEVARSFMGPQPSSGAAVLILALGLAAIFAGSRR